MCLALIYVEFPGDYIKVIAPPVNLRVHLRPSDGS